jgi:hypothetical protein
MSIARRPSINRPSACEKLYRYGDLTFFDCAGLRLLLEKAHDPAAVNHGSALYLTCADIALAVGELQQRRVTFSGPPRLIAKMSHDRRRQHVAGVACPRPCPNRRLARRDPRRRNLAAETEERAHPIYWVARVSIGLA